jgi:hypothetical protein
MFPGRRTHTYTPASIKRLSGVLIKTGLRLRRLPGPAPIGCFTVGFVASLLILVGALVQLAVELEATAS